MNIMCMNGNFTRNYTLNTNHNFNLEILQYKLNIKPENLNGLTTNLLGY